MMLLESEIDADDYPKGPWGMARFLEDRIAELEAFKAMVPRSERRPLNQHLHALRGLLSGVKRARDSSSLCRSVRNELM